MKRPKNGEYFERVAGSPAPISFTVSRRVSLSEADVMGVVWFGRYPLYFEAASQELGRRCGLAYQDFFDANIAAPVAQFHVDYHLPLHLDEDFTVRACMPWCEGAKLLTEYQIRNASGGLVTAAYTLQMLIDGAGGDVVVAVPEFLEKMRVRWRAGEFKSLQ